MMNDKNNGDNADNADNGADAAERRLKEMLRALFRTDTGGLDFGIYRILNYKGNELERFIRTDLLNDINERVRQFIEEWNAMRIPHGQTPTDISLRQSDPSSQPTSSALPPIERDRIVARIYNHLIEFFGAYYERGDFYPKRRIGNKEQYYIPYNGEDILFFWRNKGQYYVKSTEFHKNYSFKIDPASSWKISLGIAAGDRFKANIGAQKRKYIIPADPFAKIDSEKGEITFFFMYTTSDGPELDDLRKFSGTKKINRNHIIAYLTRNILRFTEENGPDELRRIIRESEEIIRAHIGRFTARPTEDYFIRKDLRGFLENELRAYISARLANISSVRNPERPSHDRSEHQKPEYSAELFMQWYVSHNILSIFGRAAGAVINLLDQIERLQKVLWEKKKYVIKTDYVITLDRIADYAGEDYLNGIIDTILDNRAQIEEWKRLFGISVGSADDLKAPPAGMASIRDCGAEATAVGADGGGSRLPLPIDTAYFDEGFKEDLLERISRNGDFEGKLDGIAFNGENWQVLNLIAAKYRKRIKAIYIDPPYNSASSEIAYKNDYKHSTWLCMMENRLEPAKELLSDDGVMEIAIDYNEFENLGALLNEIFDISDTSPGRYEKSAITIVHNPKGRQGKNLSITHEYMYVIYPSYGEVLAKERRKGVWRNLRDHGGESLRTDARTCFYPILIKNGEIVGFGDVLPDNIHPESREMKKDDGIIEVWPIDRKGIERKWRYSRNSVEAVKDNLKAKRIGGEWEIFLYKENYPFKTVWTDPKYSATDHGTKMLTNLFGVPGSELFTFPKSVHLVKDAIYMATNDTEDAIVLDFFAGSGTTAHAVMALNAEDGGKRKFILVEVEEYFNNVLIPRIKKLAYAMRWDNGKPLSPDGRGIFMKYHLLEHFEDSLENLEFDRLHPEIYKIGDFKEHHRLIWETRKSRTFPRSEAFLRPFSYKIAFIGNGGSPVLECTPDLAETFNYLLGIDVNAHIFRKYGGRRYHAITGTKEGKKYLVIWRDVKDIDYAEDKRIIEAITEETAPDVIYINHQAAVRNYRPIDTEFKRLMMERAADWEDFIW